MARMFIHLFGLGGLLVLLTFFFPHDPARSDAAMLAVGSVACLVAIGFLVAFDRLPMWLFRLAPALGSVLIAIAAYVAGPTGAPAYLFFFFWVSLSASYFFGMREAVGHAAFAAACLGAVLLLREDIPLPALLLAMVAGTLIVNGAVIVGLRYQLEGLVQRLDHAARTDSLTDLANRREFNERFEYELARAKRTGSGLGVVVLDLDRFKRVNDHFGHSAGDRALERFAGVLRAQTRRIDIAARIGGEEFALIVVDSGPTEARAVAERIRGEVEEGFISHDGLTVSCGVAAFPDAPGKTEALLWAADRALYAAKDAGRNRVSVYSPAMHGEVPPEALGEDGREGMPHALPGEA
jgi:diguanylate cyclase (GGDEF)-like protein